MAHSTKSSPYPSVVAFDTTDVKIIDDIDQLSLHSDQGDMETTEILLMEDTIHSPPTSSDMSSGISSDVQEKEHDVFLIHPDDECDQARKLKDLLELFVQRPNGLPVRVCMEEDLLSYTTNRLDLLEMALEHCPRHFVFFSESLPCQQGVDPWLQFKHTQALNFLIQRRTQIVIVKETEDVRVPIQLGFVIDVMLNRLLKGRKLRDVDVTALRLGDLDSTCLYNLQLLCNRSNGQLAAFQPPALPAPSTERGRTIQSSMRYLTDHLDSRHGLLAYLFSKSVIGLREMETFKQLTNQFDANEKLLKKIMFMNDDKISVFVNGLRETNQKHLANAIVNSNE